MNIIFASDISFNYFGSNYPGDDAALAAMAEARACFEGADFSVINLETTFGDRNALEPIRKSGANQISSCEFIRYIEYLSPSAAGLANNHTGDYGDAPLFNTMDSLSKLGIRSFGAGANVNEAYRPVCFDKKGTRVAVIGVCENEFGIAKEDKTGSAGYSLGRVTAAIRRALSDGYVPVVFFHGGNEHYPFPSPSKKELYRHFVDIGAGAVVAMHTHCPQGYEVYNGAPIIYSMGNFYFPAPDYPHRPRFKVWAYGYMCVLSFEGTKAHIKKIIPYKQDFEGIHLLHGEEHSYFDKYLQAISAPIENDELLQGYFEAWCVGTKIVSKIKKYSELRYQDMPHLKNMLCCEAHNEVLRVGAAVAFEGREKLTAQLYADIEKLQEMQIPSTFPD